MDKEVRSYRQILRSSSIIGGASVINVAIGLGRTKVVALLLGPIGVGLIGLFGNLMGTASAVAGLGFGNVGTRQIAEAAAGGKDPEIAAARRALFWGTMVLALLGGLVVWLLRRPLARVVLGDASHDGDVGWLAIGVALSVAGASQGALLNGLRRIGDIARCSVYGVLLSTGLGVGALFLWGDRGLMLFVLSVPLSGFLIGHYFVTRLPRIQTPPTSLTILATQWNQLARLGFAFMVAGLAGTLAQLFVRSLVHRELGAVALGHFQASWAISMTYIGFVLQAMGTDFYPRLTGVIHDHSQANRLVNEQTEVALLLAAPVLLGMLALAPWIIKMLYTKSFAPAVAVFRWQVLGDVLKVASWPLGFILLAAGDGRMFVLTEFSVFGVFVLLTWAGIPLLGVEATGIAFFAMYAVLLPLVYWLGQRRTGFRWLRSVWYQLSALMLAAGFIAVLAMWRVDLGAVAGSFLAALFGLHALARLSQMTVLGGRLGRFGDIAKKIINRCAIWNGRY